MSSPSAQRPTDPLDELFDPDTVRGLPDGSYQSSPEAATDANNTGRVSAQPANPVNDAESDPRGAWLVRGLTLAGIHLLVRVTLALAGLRWTEGVPGGRLVSLLILIGAAAGWAAMDAHKTLAYAEGGPDLTLRWLKVAGFAAAVSSAAYLVVTAIIKNGALAPAFVTEVTAGVAFTVLLIAIPAIAAIAAQRLVAAIGQRKASGGAAG